MTVIEIPSDSDEERPVKVKQESQEEERLVKVKQESLTLKSTPSRSQQPFDEQRTPTTAGILAKRRGHLETPSSKSARTASDESSSSSAVERLSAKEKRAYHKYKRQCKMQKRKRSSHSKDDGKIRMRDGKKNKFDETPKRAKDSVPPPPSVSPPIPPPPSVSPPPAAALPPPATALRKKNLPLGAKRGPKPKHLWTIDEYLHLARVMSAPRFETPTVALRTLHRGHLLLDIHSASVVRNAWKQVCEGVTSPLHDPRVARALEYAALIDPLPLLV